MPKPPNYGIIYNWDGAPHGYAEVPQSMEAFLEKTYAPLEDTQVGALFWCVGEHAARWPTKDLETVGDVHGRRYERAASYIAIENVRQMLERGEDPQKALVQRGRELGLHVYASVRMNDNHFGGAQAKDLPTMHHTELTRLRIEHPEWVLGEETLEWFALSWNMSVPEIREHRFAYIKELCSLYDCDGVELDWQRHAFHLPLDDAYRLRYTLTDLQRALRRMTAKLARERGKPFYVAARVSGSLEMCRRIGYDIPTWIDEGLVDILIPAANAGTDPSIEVAAFLDLCRGTNIAVYPGFDGGISGEPVGPEGYPTKDRMRTRAVASRYHRAGADGIYVFNWHANRDSRRELLSQVGSAETLQRTDKIYAATHRVILKKGGWRGAYRGDRLLGEVPVALKRTLTGDGPTVVLDVADDVAGTPPSQVQLRVRLDQWVKGDVVAVSWDGQQLQNPEVRYCTINDPHRISDVSSAAWLCFAMDPAEVERGAHAVKVGQVERHPQLGCDIVLTDVELVITYT